MTAQDTSIVEYVLEHPGVSPAALAERFGVSQRTMRGYIRRANNSMGSAAHISFKRSSNGYVCEVVDQQALDSWLERSHVLTRDDPATSTDRRAVYLLNDLLLRSDWITLDSLAEILFVSRACISNDLKRIEPILARYNLLLEKRPRYGIRIRGSEMGRRLCLADVTVRRMTSTTSASDTFEHTFEPLLNTVADCVNKVLDHDDFVVNSLSYQNLLVHIAIAVLRIKGGDCMPAESLPASATTSTLERALAEDIAEAVSRALDIELPESEVGYIAIHLAGKRVLYGDHTEGESNVITDEMWEIASRMIDVVWRAYRLDFRDDVELRMNLARHIAPLSVRLTYRMHLENPLLNDIKSRFPLAYAMAGDASTVLMDAFGYYPSEHERGYIAMAFALAIERQKTNQNKKRVLVVCASGAASAQLLAYKIKQEFGTRLAEVAACNVAQVAEQDFSQIDYVFTTVPLSVSVPVPVREITLLLSDADRALMRDVFELSSPKDNLRIYFPRELFFTHERFATKGEVISRLCERLRDTRPTEIPETFEELVWKREAAAPTSFGNAVALPHPIEAVSEQTIVTVALLDEPIDWGVEGLPPVRAVFLISFSRLPDANLDRFYGTMANLLNDGAAIQALLRDQTYERLLEELRRR